MTQEVFVEEAPELRRARLRKMEKDEADARAAQIEAVSAQTRGFNDAYFRKQEEAAKQIAEQNTKNKNEQEERDRQGAARRVAENAEHMSYHPAQNKPPVGFTDMTGTIPCHRKPSVTLQPVPAKYPSSDPRAGMDEDLIVRYGMNPDPRKKFNEK